MVSFQFFWVHSALKYIYLGFLALQFILALGNRPKSERVAYTASFYVFSALSFYLIFASLWLTVCSFSVLVPFAPDLSVY